MKASETKVVDFIARNKTQFIIPIYQRNYDWGLEQSKQLLDDIIEAGENPSKRTHFIGSIVFVADNAALSGSIKEFVIIDGQQRLTTLTLICLAIRNLAKELGDDSLYDDFTESYLINKNAGESARLKLRPTDNNAAILQALMRGDEPPGGYSNIVKNFKYFRQNITEANFKTIIGGFEKLMVVEISLDRQFDDPQLIFESMNSTGLDLSQADLIRNYILMDLNPDEQKRLYEDFWQAIEASCRENSTHESMVADFMRDTLSTANKRLANKAKVYAEFKNKWPRAGVAEWSERLARLKKSAAHYGKILNPDSEPNAEIRERLRHLNRLGIIVTYPFLLRVYSDYADGVIGGTVFSGVLDTVMSFALRRQICDLPSMGLNKIFMLLHNKIEINDYLPSLQRALASGFGQLRFPDDGEVRSALRSKNIYEMNGDRCAHILERLENHQNRERVEIEDNDDITIEHIFPRNPEAKWKLELDDGDYARLKNELLNTLGNLTLSGNNGALGAKPFAQKRDMAGKGYKDSRLWLNRSLATLDKWNVEECEKRTADLTERFLEIWPYPPESALSANAEDLGETLIGDIDDPTYKPFKYAVFLGEKIANVSFRQCYVEIVRKMFELSPEKFIGTELGEYLKITQDRPSKYDFTEVNDTWFMRTHYSNIDKIRRLKRACETLGFEDELFFKFAPDA